MTETDENVAKLATAYRVWHETKAGRADKWLEILDDEIRFRSLADGAPGVEFTQPRVSKAEVIGYFNGLAEAWEMIHYTVDEFIAQGDRVVMLGSCAWRNRKTGVVVETPKADFWRFRDGKAVEFFEFYDTAAARAAGA